jgi:hypothetical protein
MLTDSCDEVDTSFSLPEALSADVRISFMEPADRSTDSARLWAWEAICSTFEVNSSTAALPLCTAHRLMLNYFCIERRKAALPGGSSLSREESPEISRRI